MGVQVALLSAVNVGGRKMEMAPLRAACLAAGFARVETLLASGNVLIDAGRQNAAAIAKQLEALIVAKFAIATTAILRTAAALEQAAIDDPYPDCSGNRVLTIFLQRPPGKAEIAALIGYVAGRNRFAIAGDVIYVDARDSVSDIKITPAAMKRHLGQVGTARNRNTVEKLAAKARAMEAE
ncbi:MAG: DUF1697 domain-containing protein [Caulobacterales bacterium]|jgi:uncharacterized protein (DUF1697 family)